MTPEQEAKLPRYVRDELRRLRCVIRSLVDETAALRQEPQGSGVVELHSYTRQSVALADDAVIAMHVTPRKVGEPERAIHVSLVGERVELRGVGLDTLDVRPNCSNVISVGVVPR